MRPAAASSRSRAPTGSEAVSASSGCIGQFSSDQPLIALVARMAKAAATSDPRFAASRITPAEIDDLDIEISVLSPLEPTDDPLSLELGTHGIYIRRGSFSGCFLPQVAAGLPVHRRSLRRPR